MCLLGRRLAMNVPLFLDAIWLERVYRAVGWQSVDQIRYNMYRHIHVSLYLYPRVCMPGGKIIAVPMNLATEASKGAEIKYSRPRHYMELSDKLPASTAINPGANWQGAKWAKGRIVREKLMFLR
jgi:hypothetical protein